jgi:hypothetical protein
VAVNQKTELTINSFRFSQIPPTSDTNKLIDYLVREVVRLQRTVADLVMAAPQATDAAPLNPLNGMVRYAEGAWGTALGGTGLYVYKAGVWTHIV